MIFILYIIILLFQSISVYVVHQSHEGGTQVYNSDGDVRNFLFEICDRRTFWGL